MTEQLTYLTWYEDFVSTGDDTPTTISTTPIPAGTIVDVEARVAGRRTGGSAGSAEDGAGYKAWATFQNIGGSAVLIASTVEARESDSGWDVSFDVSGANGVIQVTGNADTSINWRCRYSTLEVE